MTINSILLYYLAIANGSAFILFGWDKYKALKSKWRIPEKTLLGIALLGGSAGAFIAMKCFCHKTLHKKFSWGIPVVLLLQIGLLVYLHAFY